jgi:hypothetical protein
MVPCWGIRPRSGRGGSCCGGWERTIARLGLWHLWCGRCWRVLSRTFAVVVRVIGEDTRVESANPARRGIQSLLRRLGNGVVQRHQGEEPVPKLVVCREPAPSAHSPASAHWLSSSVMRLLVRGERSACPPSTHCRPSFWHRLHGRRPSHACFRDPWVSHGGATAGQARARRKRTTCLAGQ